MRLQDITSQLNSLQGMVGKLRSKVLAKDEVQHLQDVNAVLKDENEVLVKENEVLMEENAEARDTSQHLQDENAVLKEENGVLEKEAREKVRHLQEENGVLKDKVHELQEEKASSDEMNKCSICLDKPRDTVLTSCGHLRYCHVCAEQLTVCSFCRVWCDDEDKLRLYF